eukprot:8879591-Pyramimonas_sp.AAC.1
MGATGSDGAGPGPAVAVVDMLVGSAAADLHVAEALAAAAPAAVPAPGDASHHHEPGGSDESRNGWASGGRGGAPLGPWALWIFGLWGPW